ncbi:transmembrane protein 26-like [Dendronephthya gigantea]|uniref:transmembrane protein 26-like n=1 Tax=Dendronephthya gigantea TaxID=151771 RepID=UPI00106BEC7D|nr:transmembrane protein 26-like [Dendronephthya gigantea]
MERIFTYIAALLSRFLFSFHTGITVWWLIQVTQDQRYWYILGYCLSCLLLETLVTVVYRKGHEYYWFCPSIFVFTTAEIPCFGILRLQLGSCLRMSETTGDAGIRCSTNVTDIGNQIQSLGLNTLFADDEKVVSALDQTFLLLLVIGRWLLPKGQMSREQLSQLLLIYIAAAADIVELTEIYEVRDVLSNSGMINLLIALWSISLLQFSVTIQNVESVAQDKANQEVKLEKEKERGEKSETNIEITTGKKSNRVAPALYTYKLAQRKAFERQRERRNTMDLDSLKPISHGRENQQQNDSVKKKDGVLLRILKALKRFESTVQNFIHTHIDLIQLLTPMLLQDGPFLILRLFVASEYDISESNMFLFLIAKNALVVMLQVYRICVLYCKPSSSEGTEDDIFTEIGPVKLRNVQTAHASMRTATLTMQAVSKFKKNRSYKMKRSRTFSLTLSNRLAGFRRRRNESMDTSSKASSSKQEGERSDGNENNAMAGLQTI